MARPKKNNADYFSHDNNMRSDSKILALRRKFWVEWYAVWCMLLEVLTESDWFKTKVDTLSIELLSWDFGVETNILKSIIEYLVLL